MSNAHLGRRAFLLAVAIVAGAGGGAQAQIANWQGGTSDNWNAKQNWSTTAVPSATELVEFKSPTNLPATLSANGNAEALSSTLTGTLIDLNGKTLTLSAQSASSEVFDGSIENSATGQAGLVYGAAGNSGVQTFNGAISGNVLLTVKGGALNLDAASRLLDFGRRDGQRRNA